MKMWLILSAMTIILAGTIPLSDAQDQLGIGVDCNYALDLEVHQKKWSDASGPVDPYEYLAKAGCKTARIRLWVGDDGMNQLKYATETAKRAQKAGLKPYLVIFLSDNWADYVKQPLPAIWKDLAQDKKLQAIESYAQHVVKHFAENGIEIEIFEIGNEIDFGICGVFEEQWPNRVSLDYMKQKIWPNMVPIIKAAESGVLKAQPNARFILHLAQWNNANYCIAFFQYMIDSGVQLDYPGISYFPSSSQKIEERPFSYLLDQISKISDAVKKPIVICESGYPSQPEFGGQFSTWNQPVDGYPLTESGQAKWIADYVAMARNNPKLAGAFYWSPEWFGGGLWDGFALFDENGKARAGAKSFAIAAPETQSSIAPPELLKPTAAPTIATGTNIYFGNLHSHTADSDGTGTPEEAFTFAHDVARLDFLAITDHNHLFAGEKATTEERARRYAGPDDNALLPVAQKHTKNGSFVALYGQEYSSMSKGNHVNLFDVPSVVDVANGKFDLLLKWLEVNKDTTGQAGVMQFNHPALSFPPNQMAKIDFGRDDFGDDAHWVEQMGKYASLIEILNGEPLPNDPARRSPQIMESHYRKFLLYGFHLAPTGNQDNHKKEWGTCNDTRTGIYAKALTKPDLLQAMRDRHVFASEDKNLKFIVSVNNHLTGDILKTPGKLDVAIHLTDPDEPAARYTIEAFLGTIGGRDVEMIQWGNIEGNLPEGQFVGMDGLSLDQSGQFIYFKLTQTSGNGIDHAWTAPVWLN